MERLHGEQPISIICCWYYYWNRWKWGEDGRGQAGLRASVFSVQPGGARSPAERRGHPGGVVQTFEEGAKMQSGLNWALQGELPPTRSASKPSWVWCHQVQAPPCSGWDSTSEQPTRELVRRWVHPRWGLCGGHHGHPCLSFTLSGFVPSCPCRDTRPPQAASLGHLGWGVQMMQVESWTHQAKTSVLTSPV